MKNPLKKGKKTCPSGKNLVYFLAEIKNQEQYIVNRAGNGCTGPLKNNRINPSLYYDLSQEADFVSSHGLNHMGGNWTGVHLRHDGRLSHCPQATGYIMADDFIMIGDKSMKEIFDNNMILKRMNDKYKMHSFAQTQVEERLAQFTHRDKTYVVYSIGSDNLLIPSKTNKLSPFQKDFIEAIKKGYSPMNSEGYWGANQNHDNGDLVKGVKDFLTNSKK